MNNIITRRAHVRDVVPFPREMDERGMRTLLYQPGTERYRLYNKEFKPGDEAEFALIGSLAP
jgi:hypothetical protein